LCRFGFSFWLITRSTGAVSEMAIYVLMRRGGT